MTDLDRLYLEWKQATGNLQPGVNRVFREVLAAVEDGSMTTLVWGTDYYNEGTCLVNASASMLKAGGGNGVPMRNFGEVVSLFDQINRELRNRGVNFDHYYVSPLAADILLRHFGDIPEVSAGQAIKQLHTEEIFVEPTDDDIREAITKAFSQPAPQTPFDDIDVSHVPDTIPEMEAIVDFFEE